MLEDSYRETEPNKKKWQKQAFTGPVFFQYLNGDVACHLGMGSLRVGNKELVPSTAVSVSLIDALQACTSLGTRGCRC